MRAVSLVLLLALSACGTTTTTQERIAAQIEATRARGGVITPADSARLVAGQPAVNATTASGTRILTDAEIAERDSLRAVAAATEAEMIAAIQRANGQATAEEMETLRQIEANTGRTAAATMVLATLSLLGVLLSVVALVVAAD